MRCRKGNIVKPDGASRLVTFEVRVVWFLLVHANSQNRSSILTVIKKSKNRRNNNGNTLAVSSGSGFQVHAKHLVYKDQSVKPVF